MDQTNIINIIEGSIICRFGIPQTLSTDRATIFIESKVVRYAQSRNIELVASTPYYAQANGQVKAINKILINLIKTHVKQKSKNWHATLTQILRAYRNSPKGATGTTPFKLVYGQDIVLPIEINLQSLRLERQNDLPVEAFWN